MYWMAWHYFTTVNLTPNSRVRFHKVKDSMMWHYVTLFSLLKGQDPGRGARQSSEGLWCVTFHWRTLEGLLSPCVFVEALEAGCERGLARKRRMAGVEYLSWARKIDRTTPRSTFEGFHDFVSKLNPHKTQCQSKTCLGGRLPMDLNDEIAHPGPFLNRSGRYAGDFRDLSSWLF